MELQLEIVSEHKEMLGEDAVRLFTEDGGTIGRSLENDWILPDPDRFISGRHATVDFKAGAWYLADVSSNGVYVNGDTEPLGKGNPRRLFHGDRLRMGDFEFVVSLNEGEDLDMPPDPPMTVVPDHIEQLVPEEQVRTGIELLDEEAMTGNEEFQATLFGGAAKKNGSRGDRMDDTPNPFVEKTTDEVKVEAVQELLDAFLEGLGIERAELHPRTDPLEVMRNAGRVLGRFVDGIVDLLESRAAVKSMFRLDQTMVLPRHNNPLKIAENTRDSVKQLLVGKEGEYLAPLDAVTEVCRDLKFHHDALLAGMTKAFLEFSDRFDPVELQENFDKTLNKKPVFNKMNQLKYWQLYCDLYPIMTQPGSGQFPHHFGEDFVRAYEKQIAEYKRLEGVGSGARAKKIQQPFEPEEELADQVDHGTDW